MKTIGFAYNLKDAATAGTDTHAEYESPGTVRALSEALSAFGDVFSLPCEPGFIELILGRQPDLVFNIAEGWGGRDRESFVPVVCSMLGIPHTGSDAVALGITMDKALTKRLARDAGLRTVDHAVFDAPPVSPPPFDFPVFVKPNRDGSSRGISKRSLVTDMDSLRELVSTINRSYRQPAIVEPYLDGRDFCVGLLGNDPPLVLPTCEVLLGHEGGIPFFSFEYKRRDRDRLDMEPSVPAEAIMEMESMAVALWNVLGCRDYARADFRTGSDGLPYFMEMNALPGLSPVSGIFVRQAAAAGIGYGELIEKILERIHA